MDLKGGIAYLNMHGYDITNPIEEASSVYVKDLYKDANKIVKSKKPCIIYNAGTGLINVPVTVTSYNVFNGVIIMIYLAVTSTNGVARRRVCIKPDSSYYVLST